MILVNLFGDENFKWIAVNIGNTSRLVDAEIVEADEQGVFTFQSGGYLDVEACDCKV